MEERQRRRNCRKLCQWCFSPPLSSGSCTHSATCRSGGGRRSRSGDVGEAEAVGYFLDGGGGVAQVVAHVLDDVLVDPVLGGLAALVLADHRQILGRDGEQVGIVAHGTALHLLLGERGEEAVEELAALRLVGLGLGGVGLVEDAAQAEEHRLDERLHGLLAELAVGHVHGLADEGVVEAVLAHDVVGEADDVGAADIDGAIPDADARAAVRG